MIHLENPYYLIGLVILPFIVWVHFRMLRYKKRKAMAFANFETLKRLDDHWFYSKNIGQLLLRVAFTTLIILAFADPSFTYETEGTDYNIVMAIDTSGSMLTKDIMPTRLQAVTASMDTFIGEFETSGAIGLVSFGGQAFVEKTMTEEKGTLQETLSSLSISRIPGTAIGDAVTTSISMLVMNPERGNAGDMVILVTDGQENQLTDVEMRDIISYGNDNGVVVNILGVGTERGATSDFVGAGDAMFTLNEPMLMKISNGTDGSYLRAETPEEILPGIEGFVGPTDIKKRFNIAPLLFVIAIILLFIEWNFTTYFFRFFPD